jgi:hypothetical protein
MNFTQLLPQTLKMNILDNIFSKVNYLLLIFPSLN